MAALVLKDFLNDIGCKLVFHIHRVSRDVSIDTTYLVSVFQVITISSRNSRWAELKVKAPKYLGTCNILFWVLKMMLNLFLLFCMRLAKKATQTSQGKKYYVYCYSIAQYNVTQSHRFLRPEPPKASLS
ncbi:hypothetical protein HPG69_013960, partial [Diceros bicornis minor]